MTIVTKGSGGSIKFSGSGGRLHIPGSGGGGGGGGIQPDSISGLKLWFKADSITGVADGGNVTSWADSSGNGKNLSVAYTAPKYKAASALFNNMPTVQFNPTGVEGNWNSLIVNSSGAPIGSAARTIYAVWSCDSSGAPTTSWLCGYGTAPWSGGGTGTGFGIQSTNAGANASINAVSDITPDAGAGYSFNAATLASFAYVAGSALDTNVFYLNGAAQSLGAQSNVLNTSHDNFAVGHHDNDGDQGMKGEIAEIILYDTTHDSSTRQGIETYLANKYGITI